MISRTSEYTKFVCKLLHNRFENFAYPMDAVLEILKNVERAREREDRFDIDDQNFTITDP
jgi:hypothetical protein